MVYYTRMTNPLISEERAKKLLGAGLSNSEVASTVGCDASYITQLMANDEFRAAVTELRVKSLTAATERDDKINDLETVAIEKLETMIEWVTKPRDMLTVFNVLNAAKRRGTAPKDNVIINNQIVNLTLPAEALSRLVTNARNEVVEIDDIPMITMQPSRLLEQYVARKGASDVTTAAIKSLNTRELVTAGYVSRTDASGNATKLVSRDHSDAFDI